MRALRFAGPLKLCRVLGKGRGGRALVMASRQSGGSSSENDKDEEELHSFVRGLLDDECLDCRISTDS